MWGLLSTIIRGRERGDQESRRNMGRIFLNAILNILSTLRRADQVHTPVQEAVLHKVTLFETYHSNVEKFKSMQDSVSSSHPKHLPSLLEWMILRYSFFESRHPRPDQADVDFRFFFLIVTHLWDLKDLNLIPKSTNNIQEWFRDNRKALQTVERRLCSLCSSYQGADNWGSAAAQASSQLVCSTITNNCLHC